MQVNVLMIIMGSWFRPEDLKYKQLIELHTVLNMV